VITHKESLALSSLQCFSGLPWSDQNITTVSVLGTDIFLSILDWAKEGPRWLAHSEAWQ